MQLLGAKANPVQDPVQPPEIRIVSNSNRVEASACVGFV
jgi:hypothetical protein